MGFSTPNSPLPHPLRRILCFGLIHKQEKEENTLKVHDRFLLLSYLAKDEECLVGGHIQGVTLQQRKR